MPAKRLAPAWVLLAACAQAPTDVAGVYAGRLHMTTPSGVEQRQLAVRLSARGDAEVTLDDGFCRSLAARLDDEALSFAQGECEGAADGVHVLWRPSGSGRVRLGTLTYDLAGPRLRIPQAGGQSVHDEIAVRFVGDWIGP